MINKKKYLEIILPTALTRPQTRLYFEAFYMDYRKDNYRCWNWRIFALGLMGMAPLWFVYRRLYLMTFVYTVITQVTLSLLLALSAKNLVVGVFYSNIFHAMVLGYYGNSLHLYWLERWQDRYPDYTFRRCGSQLNIFVLLAATLLPAILILYHQAPSILALTSMVAPLVMHAIEYERPVYKQPTP